MLVAETRLDQLDRLSTVDIIGNPLLVHGSVGHAALMGIGLPPENRVNGIRRDIDVFVAHMQIDIVEADLKDAGLVNPQPIDPGLCGLLVRERDATYACKDRVAVELDGSDVFDEVQEYEVKGTDGLTVRSFSPLGMLAVHRLEPGLIRIGHARKDIRLELWFKKAGITLPEKLDRSIDEFHRAYAEAYPHGHLLQGLSRCYIHVVPEVIRSRLRKQTHRFMRDHAGRITPYTD
jgi:hypothetical protein